MDANHGFWQCDLDEKSQLLTTFTTPFGRYKYKRLPFGINAAPEFFQKRVSEILAGLDGVQVNMDDFIVYGETIEEHDKRLRQVLDRLRTAQVTLNVNKCEFGVTRIKFLGHIIDANGIHVDEDRVKAIQSLGRPENISELRSLLGSINYIGRFIPNLANLAQPLNELLKKDRVFSWESVQQAAFDEIKRAITSAPVLAWYHPKRETILTADASSYGLGAVLKQRQDDGNWRPIAYASRSFTSYQRNWAQIEKEAFALAWATDRFRDFITGIHITLETDHKPLVPILSSKSLDELTPKLQRIRLRLSRYSYDIRHIPGKELGMADILSRRPQLHETDEDDLNDEIETYVRLVTDNLPASKTKIKQIIEEQSVDLTCQDLQRYCIYGWPVKNEISPNVKEFWQYRGSIAVEDGLLMYGNRILIPKAMQEEILDRLHEGHLGIAKCRSRARQSVWWPGLSVQIERKVKNCIQCIQESQNYHEPLMPYEFPERPWQRVAMDLFKLDTKWYLIVTDYYSRFLEIALLGKLAKNEVIKQLKSMFSRHGTPEEIVSDNGTHFGPLLTSAFHQFAIEWDFVHRTSSPKFPQSNGMAESAVKIIKRSLKKCKDPYEALQNYRSTPLANGFSPSELLMGRKIRTRVPIAPKNLLPLIPDQKRLRKYENARRNDQKRNYDQRHGVKELVKLRIGQKVWINDLRRSGIILKEGEEPRSYIIATEKRTVRRNRFNLMPLPIDPPVENDDSNVVPIDESENNRDTPNETLETSAEDASNQNTDKCIVERSNELKQVNVRPMEGVKTRSGRNSHPPDRYSPNNYGVKTRGEM